MWYLIKPTPEMLKNEVDIDTLRKLSREKSLLTLMLIGSLPLLENKLMVAIPQSQQGSLLFATSCDPKYF